MDFNSLAEKRAVNDLLKLNAKFPLFYSSYSIDMLYTWNSIINRLKTNCTEVTANAVCIYFNVRLKTATTNMASKECLLLEDVLNACLESDNEKNEKFVDNF